MLQVLRFLVLCLIFVIIASFLSPFIYTLALFLVLIAFFYDYNLEIKPEKHATNKVRHAYFKVRGLFHGFLHLQADPDGCCRNLTMNNKSDFDLSKFNKSGIFFSPSKSNGVRRLAPQQTSTPLTRTSPWQQNGILSSSLKNNMYHTPVNHTPRRYSLSSTNTPSTTPSNASSSSTVQTAAGPLLASTRYNINLGIYTDSKSPGLVNRIVHYHNESQGGQKSTHQAKYSSPGQFPIVQLYKKELPVIRPVRRCTVRIAPPDPLTLNSPEASAILRDSFVQKPETDDVQTEINTKSVLEALKEISRKRIHTHDDMEDTNKRQRKASTCSPEIENTNKDGKRPREDTPPKPKNSISPPANLPKRICVVNEIESSLSSSRCMVKQQGQKRKAKNTVINSKQRKVSPPEVTSKQTQTNTERGCQTVITQSTQKVASKQTSSVQTEEAEPGELQLYLHQRHKEQKANRMKSLREIDREASILPLPKPAEKIMEGFDQKPLEIMRRNRLSVMLAALNGTEPKIIPLNSPTLSDSDDDDEDDKKKKESDQPTEPEKPKKHVTFSNTVDGGSSPSKEVEKPTPIIFSAPVITTIPEITSTVTSSVPVLTFTLPTSTCTPALQTTTTSALPVLNFGISQSPEVPKLSFGAVTTTTMATSVVSTPAVQESKNDSPIFGSFAPKPVDKVDKPLTTSAPLTFNFTSSVPPSTPVVTPVPSSSISTLPVVPSTASITSTTDPTPKPVISFGPVPIMTFGAPASTAISTKPTSGGFTFGSTKPVEAPKADGGFKFDLVAPSKEPTKTTAQEKVTFSFNPTFGSPVVSTAAPIPILTPTPTPVSTTPVISFGSFGTTSKAPAFGTPSVTTAAPTTITTTTSGFAFVAKPTAAFSFNNGSFSSSSSTTAPAFGTPTTSTTALAFPSVTSAPAFGSAAPTFAFGSSTAASKPFSFGAVPATTTAAPAFSAPIFGGSAPAVSAPATTTASIFTAGSSAFGAGSSAFGGTTPGFGSAFGGNSAPTAQPSAFGSTQSAFGATPVAATPAPAGGQTGPFGGGSFGSNFGSFGAASPSQAPAPTQAGVFTFGSGSSGAAPAPAPSNSGYQFGAATTKPTFNFSSGGAPTFGATPVAQQAPAFGSTASPFGAVGAFNPAPANGMFNIGSGSTAPKQRPMIKARRRN